MHRFATPVALLLAVIVSARSSAAQTPAEGCLTLRLALLGEAVSHRMQCHAWAVGTRAAPSEVCLAHGDGALAERLRSAGCAREEEIATLLDLARTGSDALIDSQTAESRLAEFESGLWNTEAIIDFGRIYDPAMPWPDTSCRATGVCPDLLIIDCDTTQGPGGSLDTTCRSVPESRFQLSNFPVFVTENTPLPTGEILTRAGDGGLPFEVIVTLSPDGTTYTGRGHQNTLPIFIMGHRVR
jgi:hypothetical protein